MKLPSFDRRSRFVQNLKRAGMKQGQIQHVQNLYNAGKYKDAASYLRKHNVTAYRVRRSATLRQQADDLLRQAAEAKRKKLGSDKYLEFATPGELRQVRDLSAERLRELARNQRAHNPFWYHSTPRSYTQRILEKRRDAA